MRIDLRNEEIAAQLRIGWRKRAKSPVQAEQQLLRFAAGLFLQQLEL